MVLHPQTSPTRQDMLEDMALLGGSLLLLANFNRIYDWLLECFEEQGCETFILPLPRHSYIATVEPVNVEHILKSNFSNYPKGDFFQEKFQELLGRGIFNSDGEAWKIQRKTASLSSPQVSSQLFREYAVKMAHIIGKFSAAGRAFDIQDLFIGFDVEVGVLSSEPANAFATSLDKCNEMVCYRMAGKLKRAVGLGQEGSLICEFVHSSDVWNYPREASLAGAADDDDQQDHQGLNLRQNDLLSDKHHSELGRDTTADTLSWFIYQLPTICAKVQQELREFNDIEDFNVTRFSELLNYESLAKLPYLHVALLETPRLHPAVPLVKSGEMIAYSPWCMERLESLWGSDACQFRPEGWYKSGSWDFNVSTTFQAGPRVCLGRESAYLQMKITSAICAASSPSS